LTQYFLPCLLFTAAFAWAARLLVFKGSLFDPRVAPGIGPFAAGDLLFIGAVITAYLANWLGKRRGRQAGQVLMYFLLALMFILIGVFVPRPV